MRGYPWYSELGKGGESQGEGIARRGSSGPPSAVPVNSSIYESRNLLKNPGSFLFAPVDELLAIGESYTGPWEAQKSWSGLKR